MRRSYVLAGPLLMVLAVAGGAAGCGSSASTKAGAPPATVPAASASAPPTRATYIARVDGLCRVFDAERRPVDSEINRLGEITNEPIEQVAAKLVPLYEKEVTLWHAFSAKVRAVPQPPADAAVLEKLAAANEREAVTRERLLHLVKTNPEPAAYGAIVKEVNEENAPARSLAQGYGFKVCSAEHTTRRASNASSGSSGPAGAASTPTLRIGQSAIVGTLKITPTSFVRLGGSGEVVKWRVAMTVKNVGSQPVQAFCGGEASLTDDLGRVYEGEGVASEANSQDCGEKLQPGLTGSTFLVDFKTSTSAKPATLSLWGESEYSAQARTWTVR
jgi:hypothetical protein